MPDPGIRLPSFTGTRLHAREFELLRDLIFAETGISLSPAKRVLVESRLSRRLRALGFSSFESYCDHLVTALDEELVPLINCITTNKTEFFREPHHFDYLRTQVLPAIEARATRTGRRRLRIWSAGCSTGEEPYSLALVVREWMQGRSGWDVRILASDIDTNVLDIAQRGCYARDRVADVPAEWRARWFQRADTDGDQAMMAVDDRLRDLITFRRINLNDEPWPIRTAFDVVLCRNVIIYFNRETQTRLLTRFASFLEPDGHLIIGHSESLAWMTDLFSAVRGVPSVYTLSATASNRIGRRPLQTVSAPPPTASLTAAGPAAASAAAASPSVASPRAASPTAGGPRAANTVAALPPAIALSVGEVRASASGECLRTVLGSCVAVALFDPESRVGGLNHFILPEPASAAESSPRYGVSAMPALIEALTQRGAVATRLRAKLFGGAEPVGSTNVAWAKDFLARAGIPVVAACVGGAASIELYFDTDTGRARVRELRGETGQPELKA